MVIQVLCATVSIVWKNTNAHTFIFLYAFNNLEFIYTTNIYKAKKWKKVLNFALPQ